MAAEQVGLGVPDFIDECDLYKLQSHYFPIGKIGGKPAWLDPLNVPTTDDLKCEICQKSMAFVMQLYASGAEEPEHAFHRYLYVFVCRNGECSKANRSENLCVLRSQLPLKNAYYDDKPLNKFIPVNAKTTFENGETAAKLCNTCGLKAKSKCAKCSQIWYCSRDHQVIDWNSGGHKKRCGKAETEDIEMSEIGDESLIFSTSNKVAPAANSFLFREFGVKLITGYMPKSELDFTENKTESESDSESDEDDLEENEDFKREQQEHLDKLIKKLNNEGIDTNIAKELSDTMRNVNRDHHFERFSRVVDRNPTQVLRYARHKQPLRPSDYIELIYNIPKCPCGSARSFEFQLMPHLLTLMDVDSIEASIDWATVCVYTCAASCSTIKKGFSREFVVKYDFLAEQQQREVNG